MPKAVENACENTPTLLENSGDCEVRQPRRRKFSATEKLSIVQRADACAHGEVGALLREVGIYSSMLTQWRKQFHEGGKQALMSVRRGRKITVDPRDKLNAELEKKNKKLQEKLEMAHKILEIQKKVSLLLGIEFPTDEARS